MIRSTLSIIFLSFIVSTSLLWGSTSVLETKIKAAYLYNFTKFVEWPQNGGKPVKICILGDSGISKILEELSAKQGDKKEFLIQPITKAQIESCDILYLSGSDREVQNALELAKERDILTVSDNEGFSNSGGIVTLFSESGKIRFSINIAAAKKTNLKISSKLLELAKTR